MEKLLSLSFLFIVFLLLPTTNYPLLTIHAAPTLNEVNQKVCNRFEEDTARLAAIMEELRTRKGIQETRVAFGGIDDQIKSADYWVTSAAEAIAFQKAQKYASQTTLKSSLQALAAKVRRSKNEVRKVLDE